MARITRTDEEEWEVPAPEPITFPSEQPVPEKQPAEVPAEPKEVPA